MLLLLAATTCATAQTPFTRLRFDDDFLGQRQQCAGAVRDWNPGCWKAIPLTDSTNTRLSIGGQIRGRVQAAHNPELSETGPPRHDAASARMSAFAAFDAVNPADDLHVRAFAQLAWTGMTGSSAYNSPVEESGLEASNLFMELDGALPRFPASRVGLRYGIQEVRLGSARLVDVRDGPNVRRSFQGGRAYLLMRDTRIDLMDLRPRDPQPGDFDDHRSTTQQLRSLYAARTLPARQGDERGLDLYAMDFRDTAPEYPDRSGIEERWTLGARYAGRHDRWSWDWEAAVQGGNLGSSSIRAWTLATRTARTFPQARGEPELTLLMAVASGDRGDEHLRTFNPMYPRGDYFGEDATLGPRNFYNVHPMLGFSPARDWTMEFGIDAYYRQSTRDGIYAPNGQLLYGPGTSSARHVATIGSINVEREFGPRLVASLAAAYLVPGRFLRDSGDDEPTRYLELNLDFRF